MIHRKIHINDWCADIYFCITRYEEDVLELAFRSANAPIEKIVRMREIARDDEYNTGLTYSNASCRKSVMVVGKATSIDEFFNSFCHELRHLTDDIAYEDRIGLRGEAVGYLQGGIGRLLTDMVGMFLCPQCNQNSRNDGTKYRTSKPYSLRRR